MPITRHRESRPCSGLRRVRTSTSSSLGGMRCPLKADRSVLPDLGGSWRALGPWRKGLNLELELETRGGEIELNGMAALLTATFRCIELSALAS